MLHFAVANIVFNFLVVQEESRVFADKLIFFSIRDSVSGD
jgi:hypothetical protein